MTDIFAEPEYLDVTLPAHASFEQPVTRGHNAFAYVFEGGGTFGDGTAALGSPKMIVLGDGDIVRAQAGANGLGSCSYQARRSANRSPATARS